jgi:hypothetical protein
MLHAMLHKGSNDAANGSTCKPSRRSQSSLRTRTPADVLIKARGRMLLMLVGEHTVTNVLGPKAAELSGSLGTSDSAWTKKGNSRFRATARHLTNTHAS